VPTILTPGTNRNVTAGFAGTQAESTVAIDPTNSNRAFSASNPMNFRYSTDGGVTWSNSNVSGLQASCCDNQAAWDRFGNLFVVYIDTTLTNVVVVRSTNGGQSFTQVYSAAPAGLDQPSIAVGPSNTAGVDSVWIDYHASSGIMATGATVTGLGAMGSFVTPKATGSGSDANFGGIAISNTGAVIVTYQNNTGGSGQSTIFTSTDPSNVAGNFNARVTVTNSNVGGFTPIPAQPHRDIDAEANVAADHSHNWVYLVYTDRPSITSNNLNIFLRVSRDNGATWGAAQRVNDDTTTNSHFNDALAVDQSNGDLGITWYDCRNAGAANNTAQIWGTVLPFTASAFAPNVQISAGTSSGASAPGGFDFGDYDTMDFDHGSLVRTWADNSSPSALVPANPNPPSQKIGFCRVTVIEADHLSLSAPATTQAGQPFAITVSALDPFNSVDINYPGTVHFAASNGAMANYAFTAADHGQHTFSGLVLFRAATLTLTGTDQAHPSITGMTSFTITPAAADHIAIQVSPSLTAGMPFDVTVTVQDAYGNTVTGYMGTVHFQLTGPVNPSADYIFTPSDMGTHTFSSLVLTTTGNYTLTATDQADPLLTGSASFMVS
jgi:hypothetical protein